MYYIIEDDEEADIFINAINHEVGFVRAGFNQLIEQQFGFRVITFGEPMKIEITDPNKFTLFKLKYT